MLRPTKYTDLSVSVISVASVILAELRKVPAVGLAELSDVVVDHMNDGAVFNFTNALSLLYTIGAIDYDEAADAIYLIRRRSPKAR